MFITHHVRTSSALKAIGYFIGSVAVLAAAVAGCATGSSPEGSDTGRPSGTETVYVSVPPTTTGVSETETTEPSTAPSTSRPEASASESSDTTDCAGWVIAKFGGGNEGSYFVLVPKEDDDKPSQAKLAENVRRNPDDVPPYVPYASDTFEVPVTKTVYASYNTFDWYPCDTETTSSSTGQ